MADNQTPKRPHYFKSQFLTLRDFDDEQTFHLEMMRRHNRGLHGWGVVRNGLQITALPDNKGLLIKPGSAIDNLGREIVLDSAAVLFFKKNDQKLEWNTTLLGYELKARDVSAAAEVTGTPLDVYLTISFKESKSDDPIDEYPPPGGRVNVTRMRQTPLLKVENTPPADGSSIILARVTVSVGEAIGPPDMSVRPQIGCLGPLSLTSADGKLQFGIDYDSQSDALRVRARTKDAPSLDATHLTIERGTGKVGIGTTMPKSNLHLDVATSANPVSAMSIDVQSFGASPNAKASHFFRVRDIVNNSTPFYIRGDGHVGIGTTKPLGPLSVGDASVDGSDGYIVIGKKSGDKTRQYKIGFDDSHNFVIGDYGGNNDPATWKPQFAINWNAPDNSLYIDGNGKVGIGTNIPKALLDVSGGGAKIGAASDVAPAAGRELVLTPVSGTSAGMVFQHNNVDTVFLKSDSTTRLTTFGANAGTFLAINNKTGNVGIGTGNANPTERLDVRSSGPNVSMNLRISNSDVTSFLSLSPGITSNQNPAIMWLTGKLFRFGTADKVENGETTNFVERVRITGDGNVGIGTKNPGDKLTIQGGALSFEHPTNPVPYVGLDYDVASDKLRFRTSVGADKLNVTAMVIDRVTGNVGIGTKNPGDKLTIQGGALSFQHPTDLVPYVGLDYDAASDKLRFRTNVATRNLNATVMVIDRVTGRVGIGTTNPKGPLSVGDASVDGSDGYLMLGKKNGNFTRQCRIGYDTTSNLWIGDYGNENNPTAWKLQFGINWGAPSNSLYIDKSGNVGIGTTDPKAKLHVGSGAIQVGTKGELPGDFVTLIDSSITHKRKSEANPCYIISPDLIAPGHAGIGFAMSGVPLPSGGTAVGAAGGHNLGFYTTDSSNLAERMRIDSTGKVGIGTTSPGNALQINSGTAPVSSQFRISANNSGSLSGLTYSVDNVALGFDVDYASGVWTARHGSVAWLYKISDKLLLQGSTGNTIGSQAVHKNYMTVDLSNGNVGIGANSPTKGKLEVDGSVNTSVPGYHYLNRGGVHDHPGTRSSPYSIWASQHIAAVEFDAFSDERIKNIRGRSDSVTDLHTLLGIEITDYIYRDVITKGSSPHKKVTGQQVERVFPQAVSKLTDVVPDIYQQASVADGWVALSTDLEKGERVRLISDKTEGVYEVLEVAPDKFRADFKPEGDRVFVFGREVKDFRTVDYDAISMLNVSATQQLKKEKDEEVKSLRAENADLKSRLDALEAAMQRLLPSGATPATRPDSTPMGANSI